MKHVSLKIIGIFLFWMVCTVVLSAGTIQTGIEMGFLSLLLLFLLFYFFGKKSNLRFDYIKGEKNYKQRLPEVFAAFGWCKIMWVLSMFCVALIALCIDVLPEVSESVPTYTDFGILTKIALTGIFTPIVEEFVFRGVIFDLTKGWKRRSAMLFNVLFFAIVHIDGFTILGTIFAGVALYELREKHNDIISCIMLHIIVNLIYIVTDYGDAYFGIALTIASSAYYLYYVWRCKKDHTLIKKRGLCIKF